ncbi:carboxylating nicotinate-nucleotide diphosphorylase [Kangiella sediminilitoris]|uniref:Probable nicotinate-nucleotide pyrophosphorylase [carboxylating] n=1 Tax=Kangiella sediminilitoris TaxID=1144748 RepID=A0A1B3BCB0_9GAMM|nr:carboxylating nicotinate-nucleotide diphosphorylase [Kangiella sediminilitoris]AOE50446.1 nicotinate-nucleotide pyrophosphorylase [Kangiella sediminilitoris]
MIDIPYQKQLKDNIEFQVNRTLEEDLNGLNGLDVTAELIEENKVAKGRLITREDAVVCGIDWFNRVFEKLDPSISLSWQCEDGEKVSANDTLCEIEGNARKILTAERSAMNFLQTLSGTATMTARYVSELKGTNCQLLDTRKTIPMMRLAQKYAVYCGGGKNHRMGLFDAFLIKENHIISCGSIKNAVITARLNHPDLLVEVEVETFSQLDKALDAGADVIMLDNFSIDDMRTGVAINKMHSHTAKIEASGNVTLETLRDIAETGVDFISVGALTKNLRAVDLSLRLDL